MSTKTTKKTTTTTSSSSVTMGGSSTGGGGGGSRSSASRKSATPQPQSGGSQTPASATGSSAAHSPLSPTKYSRLHEKAELANLNDRLACYIDRVRHLEAENNRLTREVHTQQETITREVTSVKSMYESELSEARKLLDELSREKAKLEIDTRRLFDEKEELKSDLENKNKELSLIQTSYSVNESRLSDITAKYNQLQQERKKLADENKNLEKERNKLATQLSEARKFLEEETLLRVDLENSIQSVREELAFKEQVHEQQLLESRTKKQVEISEIDGRLSQEYEERLYQSLQDIRDQYEIDLKNNKDEIKLLYEEKIRSLASQLARNSNAASMAIDEMRQMQLRSSDMTNRVAELEAENNAKNQRLRELEKLLEAERSRYIGEFSKLDGEITRLREEMARQVQDYQELMDIKVALDLEISAYRKLLEGEEARLNITPMTSPASRSSPRKGSVARGKRKRTLLEENEESASTDFTTSSSSKGDIEISEVCTDGRFVKIINKGSKEMALSGWQLIRKAGDATIVFKFPRTAKIEPGNSVCVWSSDVADQIHEPPENIVMKNQKWLVADHMTTTLYNTAGEEMASLENKKHRSMLSVSRQRDTGGFYARRGLSSDIYQQGDQGEEKCRIM